MQMSRASRARTWLLAAAVIPLAIVVYALALWVAWLNHRMSAELVDGGWKTPVRIYSVTAGGDEPFLELYGPDWRVADPVELDELPDHVPNAFIAAEDLRFRRHLGVDPIGIARALVSNLRSGGIEQGGSTLNQQLIKSKFLTAERSYRRKLVEAILAIILDARMSKDQILEAYLNEVYLGHQRGRPVLGIDEGARLFFRKDPQDLTAAEAALIASIIPAPNRDTPEKRPEVAKRRRDTILERMKEREWIDEKTYEKAIDQPARFRAGALPETPYRYYLSAMRTELEDAIGSRRMNQHGLQIVTEMDPELQQAAERAVRNGTSRLQRRYSWLRRQSDDSLQAALLSMDPSTGGVRALVGGSDFRKTQFDRTSQMQRQPGSAFKPFAFVVAIENKSATPATLLRDTPLRIELAKNDVWEPHNYDERFRGRVSVREAFEKSLNVPTIRLAERVGGGSIISTAERMGIDDTDLPDVPALPLGVAAVSMRDLVTAYSVFPNLGERVEPGLISEVRNAQGKVLHKRAPKKQRVLDPPTAYVMHSLLRGVVRRGTASRLRRYGLGHAAGKTGTTNDYRDAWFVGYTPDLLSAVWVGFDRGAPLRLSSAEAAIPLWAEYTKQAGTSREEIEMPEGVVSRRIDPESGYLWAEGCPGPFTEVFLSGTAPTRRCPRGVIGRALRRVLFDEDSFDEPPAITFDKFRRWANEIDRDRQRVENWFDRVRGWFRRDEDEE